MNNKITWKHLQRLLTSQEFFVWNDYGDDILDDEIIENSEDFWDLVLDLDDEYNLNDDIKYVEVHKNGFDIVQKQFIKWIRKQYPINDIYFVKEKSLELRISETKKAMLDENIKVILFPAFEYENLISTITLLDKQKHKISNFKANTSTKRVDYIKAYFDLEVMKKNNYLIEDYSIFTIEIKDFIEGDDLTFSETFYANIGNTKPKAKNKTIPALQEAALCSAEKCHDTIFEKIKKNSLLGLKENSMKQQLSFSYLDFYINKINSAKEIKREPLNEKDKTLWGANRFFDILAKDDFKNLLPISGRLCNKNKILSLKNDQEKINDFYQEYEITKKFIKHENAVNLEQLNKILLKLENQKVIWYDFEGFSLPFPILSYTQPFQQLVFQVSVIETNDDQIVKINNIVLDPKEINYEDFFVIIDAIYQEEANAYVVYNKSYENTRLKEMQEIFYKESLKKHDSDFNQKIAIYNQKIMIIIERTVDLLDLFNVTSLKNNLPAIFLWELYGFSSIKRIEKYITKSKIKLPVMIEPYSSLKVQNGLMAMSKAIDRRMKAIGDEEWDIISQELKKYCENDVKAMLMVYHFAQWIKKNGIN